MPICLICKKDFIRPVSHCVQKHNVNARQYKEMFGLDLKKGIAAQEYKDKMRAYVFKNGIDKLLAKNGTKTRFIKDHKINYKRSEQTLTRLKKHWAVVADRKGKPITVEKIKIFCAVCGKEKFIYPRYYKENNNYCGVVCRNVSINKRKFNN